MLGIEKLTKNINFLEEKLIAQSLRLTNIEKLIEKHNLATDVSIIEVKELINNLNFRQNFIPEVRNTDNQDSILLSLVKDIKEDTSALVTTREDEIKKRAKPALYKVGDKIDKYLVVEPASLKKIDSDLILYCYEYRVYNKEAESLYWILENDLTLLKRS